jgi:Mg-chelatase subunit ChlD
MPRPLIAPAIPQTSPANADTDSIAQQAAQKPKIEVVFVLDTTGSMSGLINAAKEKIWSIASTMAQAQTAPEIKMGLVAYRDRGDAYITQTIDLSKDLDSMYAKLMDFQARGGGDGPESVNQALYDAVHKMSWNQDDNTYKVVFLVGDAPAHMDYQDDVKYPETVKIAGDKGIVINAIQSGNNRATTQNWQQIANLGQGNYFQVSQSGNAVAIATPFDADLARLSAELDTTRVYYGNAEDKRKQSAKVAASSKLYAESSTESQARRAAFNTSSSGKGNFLGEKELVEEVISGKAELADISSDELPSEMKVMAPAAQQEFIKEKAETRQRLQSEIRQLSEKRDSYLKEKVAASGTAKDSLDVQIFEAIQKQSASIGLVYDAKDMKY